MAVVKNLMVRAGADFSAIVKQSAKASASMKAMSTTATTVGTTMKKALGAIGIVASLGAIVAATKSAMDAYNQSVEAEAKLAQVMKNTMDASAGEVREIKELCAAQQALGVVEDDVQIAGAQELATYLEQTETLKKLIPVMNDMVAQQYGFNASAESATNIATMLGKVMDGQVGALSRYGYKFDKAQEQILKYGTEAERAATLAEVVEQSVGGMNQALANTPTGRMMQLRNTLGDIKEQFGEAATTVATVFLPVLNRVASLLGSIAGLAMRVAQAIANVFGKKMSSGTAAVSAGADGASEALDDMADSASGAGKAAKEAAKSVLGFDQLNKLTSQTDSSGGGKSSAAGGGGLGGLADTEEETAESATGLEKALQKVKDLITSIDFEPLKQAAERLKDAFGGLAETIGGALSWAFDNILTPLAHWTIESAAPAVINMLASAFELLNSVLQKVAPVFEWLYNNIFAPFAAWVANTFVGIIEYLTGVFESLREKVEKASSLGEFLKSLDGMEMILIAIAVAIVAVSAALTVMKIANTAVSALGTALKLLTSPTSLAVLAIAALVAAGIWLYKNWDTVKEKFTEIWDKIKAKFQEGKEELQADIDNIKIFFAGLKGKWENIKEALAEKWDAIKEKFVEGKQELEADIESIKEFFAGLGEKWEEIKTAIAEKWDAVKSKFTEGKQELQTDIENIKAFFAGLSAKWEGIRAAIAEKWDAIKSKFTEGKKELQTDIENIKAFFVGLKDKWNEVKEGIATKVDELRTKFTNLKTIVEDKINSIKEFFQGLYDKWQEIKDNVTGKIDELTEKFTNAKSSIDSFCADVGSFFVGLWNTVSAPIQSIVDGISSIVGWAQSAIAWLQELDIFESIKKSDAEWQTWWDSGAVWEGMNFATGGFPDVGELFVARENGPELVGTIGGQTAVANNDQIVEAISIGVFEAVTAAFGGSGNGQPVIINLDGREIARTTTKYQRQEARAGAF